MLTFLKFLGYIDCYIELFVVIFIFTICLLFLLGTIFAANLMLIQYNITLRNLSKKIYHIREGTLVPELN